MLDTSAVVKSLRQNNEFSHEKISVITLLEVLRGIKDEKRTRAKKLMEEAYEVKGINNEVILKYCMLYDSLKKSGELIPDADLIIAATSIVGNEHLETTDSDFRRLEKLGLRVVPVL